MYRYTAFARLFIVNKWVSHEKVFPYYRKIFFFSKSKFNIFMDGHFSHFRVCGITWIFCKIYLLHFQFKTIFFFDQMRGRQRHYELCQRYCWINRKYLRFCVEKSNYISIILNEINTNGKKCGDCSNSCVRIKVRNKLNGMQWVFLNQ